MSTAQLGISGVQRGLGEAKAHSRERDEHIQRLLAKLAKPFDPAQVKWKPQTVREGRALAAAYIDARTVMDRLDSVLGPENWQDRFVHVEGGGYLCELSIRIDGEWLVKSDIGAESEQPDAGDRKKAAISDALKRAAVHWGIGRYLYRLPLQWVDYDSQKKRFAREPQLPAWAMPKRLPDNFPKNGTELKSRLSALAVKLASERLCQPGELMERIDRIAKLNNFTQEMSEWGEDEIEVAIEVATAFNQECKARQAQQEKAMLAESGAARADGGGAATASQPTAPAPASPVPGGRKR